MENYKNLNDYEIVYMVKENDEDAANLLLDKYRPIILSLAKHYYSIGRKCGLELDDFIQEGNYALFYATKMYTENKNSIFYTYSILCIKSRMQNLIVRNTTNRNIALNSSVSFNKMINGDSELLDFIVDENAILPDVFIEVKELEETIKSFLYNLSFDYATIFELKINGFTNKDIQGLLNKKPDTVRKALINIKKNLKLYIDKLTF